ncbi:MAG: TonB-dependent receptor [Bacteroidaceae bacterium]|nr:TonB-dependent receptor [Bacteroidaceae bacterium]
MRKLLIYLLLYLCLPTLMWGQGRFTISGRVTDTQGAPLPMAGVAVMNSTMGAYTDDEGRYTLSLPAGRHTLVVQLVGYATERREVNVQRNTVQDFQLRETTTTLDNVVVFGKSQSQQLREGAFSVNAVDIGEISNSITNVNDIVNRTTGIKVRTEGGLGSDFDLSINGLSGNSVRYFIDGVPMDTKGSEVSLANFPVNLIDHVEIYKGVVPAHLGSDALGGAINIITKREKRNTLDASVSAGSFHTYIADFNARYYVPGTNISIKPTLGYNYSKNDYTVKDIELWDAAQQKYVPKNAKHFHDDYQSVLAEVEVGIENQTWADQLAISASYTKVDKELQNGAIQSIVYGMAERQQDAWNLSARYVKKDFLLKHLDVNALLSHTWDHSITIDTAYRKYSWDQTYIVSPRNEITGRAKQMRNYKRPLTIARANLNYDLGKGHELNFNYMLTRNGNRRYDDVDADFEPSNDVLTKHVLSLAYNQRLFHDHMENAFFIKDYINHVSIEQNDQPGKTHAGELPSKYTKNYLGYGFGTRYEFFEPLALKASYEHTARLPLSREMLGNGTTIYPNLALQPENSDNYNLGVFGNVRLGSKHLLYYEMGGFYRHVTDYIRLVVSETEGMLQYENVKNVDMKGVEGELRYSYADRLQLTANMTYQNALNKNKYKADGQVSATYNNKVPNRPWLFGNAELTLNFRNVLAKNTRLRLNYQYQYVHWFFLTWEAFGARETKARIPNQHIHSAGATYSWKDGRYNFSLECSDLFDAKAYDNYKLQKPGRSFLAKFRLLLY